MNELRRMFVLFTPYRGWLFGGIGLSLLALLGNVGLLALSGWFIAAMGLAGAAGVSMNYFTPAAGIRALAILRTGGRYAERLVSHEATFRLLAELRVWFYRHLEPLAPAALQGYRSGDLLSRLRADIDTLDHFYLRILGPLAVALLGVPLIAGFMAWHSPAVAWATLSLLLAVGLGLPLTLGRLAEPIGRRLVERRAELRSALVDGLQGLGELTVYGRTDHQAERVRRLSDALIADQMRLVRLGGLSQAGLTLGANLALWFTLLLAIPLVRGGALSGPNLAMLALLALACFEAVAPVPMAFQLLGETRAAARRLFAIVDQPPAVNEPQAPSPEPRNFGLSLEGIDFGYRPERPVLTDLNLSVAPGERVAVVGASGTGKTTLLQLILGFWRPERGRIRLGGHDLDTFRAEDLRRYMAVVAQSTHLFNTSIRDNLLLADPKAGDAELQTACLAAQIHDWIRAQPDGYDTLVGETGARLSGGQARRIAIARALLKDAPVVLLDEPTEGLDPVTEREVLAALDTLMTGRTVLLITHRDPRLIPVDRVLTLEHGRLTAGKELPELLAE